MARNNNTAEFLPGNPSRCREKHKEKEVRIQPYLAQTHSHTDSQVNGGDVIVGALRVNRQKENCEQCGENKVINQEII